MSFCKQLSGTYFFGFNVVHCAVSLLLTIAGIYLQVQENTKLNRALLICSIIYLLISMWGLGYRRGFSGARPSNLYLVMLALMTIFQLCIFAAYTLFQNNTLSETSKLDNGFKRNLSNFLFENLPRFQILLGIGAVAQILALLSGIIVSKPSAVISRDYNPDYDVHRAYAVEYV